MTAVSYIRFVTDDPAPALLDVKYSVFQSGMKERLSKRQSINEVADGSPDIADGTIVDVRSYTIKAKWTENRTGYGTFSNLKTLYSLNNPNGVPTNRLVFYDHHSTQYLAMLIGDFEGLPLGVDIEGNEAVYYVNVTVRIIG